MRGDNAMRRRENKNGDQKTAEGISNVINPMMMANMYPQGNMMMSGMFNMMMPNPMMAGGMMPSSGMEMMQSTSMEIISQPPIDITAMGTQPLAAPPLTPSMDMSMMGGVMMDPSIMGMFPNMSNEIVPEKKEIVLKHSKLVAPAPGTPQPPRRTRPPGCRTIFVGGLPEKIRENAVREIFERYGRIQILRLSKKNFCHIRFDRESCVDAAMVISGYRIKVLNKEGDKEEDDNNASSGWLHVDYALSRDDQNEYERRQRLALRVQQQQMQQMSAQHEAMSNRNATYRRSPSPLRIQPFSATAIVQLTEKIKSEEHFATTLPTLISWLERGECSKKSANQFYSMIQATNSHIRRLFNEKMQAEEELQECKDRVKNNIQNVIEQLEQVGKVFNAATHQRVWDHFTKPQRKNIETWQKMTQEFNTLKEEFSERFFNDDSEYNGTSKGSYDSNNEDINQLKRENESLQFQLEAYKNEVEVIKNDAQKEMEKFKAQFIARQALLGAMENKPPLPSSASEQPPPPPPLPDDADDSLKTAAEVAPGEARLIGVMSAFLQVHPRGASLDYVVSYVRALFPNVTQAIIHHVLQKYEDVFQKTTSGVGANIENRWTFVAFNNKT
ncbi:ecto-NOX disulfide-thiol exchanger 2-like isoform X2 [Danaus plexippus]|nr:ecto-NOX disulfide-thiol exchanger 2-like isoform X2 [Danaus plexippus]